MNKIIGSMIFFVLFHLGHSQNFEHLDSLVFTKTSGKWYHGADISTHIAVIFDKALSTIINERRAQDYIDVIVAKIDKDKSDKYLVQYNPGPSADPTYHIFKIDESDTTKIGYFGADEIVIPGDGFIYASARTNRMFKIRRKFRIVNDRFVEVKQPYFFVGLQSKTVKDITIFSDTLIQEPVAYLPEASDVTVLLNTHDYYLIATPYGLTGWTKIAIDDDGRTIYDIFRAGD